MVMEAGSWRWWQQFQFLPLLLLSSIVAALQQPEEQLIGWLGETYVAGGHQLGTAAERSGMTVVSWDPRIFHYRRFLSDEECDHIWNKAQPRLEKSGVSDVITGEQKTSKVRTSSGMFFERAEDEVIARVEQRVATVTMLPAGNAEGMQVLHYVDGQRYEPHHDYFSFAARDKNGGNRMATVLMYLTDVEAGGETVFPHVPKAAHQTLQNGWSNCSLQGLSVKPRRGDATIFWSIRPDGTFDHKSLHGSCPVIKGTKISATKWIHVAHFATGNEVPKEVRRTIYAPPPPPVPSWCQDKYKECPVWAESGECIVNPKFMVGNKASPGQCLASCARCDLLDMPATAQQSAAARRLLKQEQKPEQKHPELKQLPQKQPEQKQREQHYSDLHYQHQQQRH